MIKKINILNRIKSLYLKSLQKKEQLYLIALIVIFLISMWGKQNGGIYIIILLIFYLYEKELISLLNRIKKIGFIELGEINNAIELAPYDIKIKIRRSNPNRLSDEALRMSFIRDFTEFEKIIRNMHSNLEINRNNNFFTLQQALSNLVKMQRIDPYILTSYMDIKNIRNALVHGMHENISRDTILKSSELLNIMIDLLKQRSTR